MPQASFLPSVEVSETQAMRDAEIVALNNLPELQREPSQAPKRYINKDGSVRSICLLEASRTDYRSILAWQILHAT